MNDDNKENKQEIIEKESIKKLLDIVKKNSKDAKVHEKINNIEKRMENDR